MLKIGSPCPPFKGIDQHGNQFDSAEVIGKKNVIIYFYPKNETKVCTAQACSFRDNYEIFKDHNCEVIGISGDSAASHEAFAKNHHLPFILLSDGDKELRKTFQVPKDYFGFVAGRYTFIIDEKGTILDIFHDATHAENHTKRALKILNLRPDEL